MAKLSVCFPHVRQPYHLHTEPYLPSYLALSLPFLPVQTTHTGPGIHCGSWTAEAICSFIIMETELH